MNQPEPAQAPRARAGESPIFARAYDMTIWLIPMISSFPKEQRFRLAARLESSLFAFHDCLLHAARGRDTQLELNSADIELERMRFYLRLAQELHFLSFKQYEHATRLCNEVGRLLGGWQKKQTTLTPDQNPGARGGRQ